MGFIYFLFLIISVSNNAKNVHDSRKDVEFKLDKIMSSMIFFEKIIFFEFLPKKTEKWGV